MSPTKAERVLAETKVAYADRQRHPPTEEDYAKRNLSWRASEWLTLEELEPCLLAIGDYNLFRPQDVIEALGNASETTIFLTEYQPARESSVALYISCVKEEAKALRDQLELLAYDEYDYTNGVLRLWWD